MKFLDTLSRTASATAEKWNKMTPGEKARFATVATVCTVINPLIPVVYAGVYGTAAVIDESKND